MPNYLSETEILNFRHPKIQALLTDRGWRTLPKSEALKRIYYFVKDEIKFGYNRDDNIRASDVLVDGYGQCNTKSTLFMALLRSVNIPCRLHGFTIFNKLQRGAIPNILMILAPERILHTWVEVEYENKWLELEGFIVDSEFLDQIQKANQGCQQFEGYGIATSCLSAPPVEFDGNNTYIQSNGIADDYGVFNSPDDFYRQFGSNLSGVKKILYRYLLRHWINHNVNTIRVNGLNKG